MEKPLFRCFHLPLAAWGACDLTLVAADLYNCAHMHICAHVNINMCVYMCVRRCLHLTALIYVHMCLSVRLGLPPSYTPSAIHSILAEFYSPSSCCLLFLLLSLLAFCYYPYMLSNEMLGASLAMFVCNEIQRK